MRLDNPAEELQAILSDGGLSAWVKTVRLEPSVATPLRFLYQDYRSMCREEGFPEADVETFVQWVSLIEGTSIIEGGKGLIRRAVLGAMPGR
jgi:hypothetical protein